MSMTEKGVSIVLLLQMRDGSSKEYRLESIEDAEYCDEVLSEEGPRNYTLRLRISGSLDKGEIVEGEDAQVVNFEALTSIRRAHVQSHAISVYDSDEAWAGSLVAKPVKDFKVGELYDILASNASIASVSDDN